MILGFTSAYYHKLGIHVGRTASRRRLITVQSISSRATPDYHGHLQKLTTHFQTLASGINSSNATAEIEDQMEPEIAKGYTMTRFCDRLIEVFLYEKTQPKDWRKLLVFRDEWKKYSDAFYRRCELRANSEEDLDLKYKLVELARKVRKIDHEMERHSELLKEIQDNPTDINSVVAKQRKEFTEEFFRHINIISEVSDTLDDRDAMTRLGAKCISAVRAYDNAAEDLEMLDVAQKKFDEILNSPSLEVACDKIRSLAKAKELDSALILLINGSWAAAKDSQTIKSEVKDIMYHIYKTTKSSLKSIMPKEIKLLKYLLNITDPEERFSALATAFSPGDEHEPKNSDALYSTPKELHKWIKIMLDSYQLNKEECELREVRNLGDPIIIQRLFILNETIEKEYLKNNEEQSKDLEST